MDCEKGSSGLEATKHQESGGSRSQRPFHGIIEDFGRPQISVWNSHKYIQTQLDTFRRLDIMPPNAVSSKSKWMVSRETGQVPGPLFRWIPLRRYGVYQAGG